MATSQAMPSARVAQKILAAEVTELIHGSELLTVSLALRTDIYYRVLIRLVLRAQRKV